MKIEKKHLLDYTILIPYLILSVVGLIVVYSTTSARLVALGANPVGNHSILFIGILVLYLFSSSRLETELPRKDKLWVLLLL